jgi:hypothetical protein
MECPHCGKPIHAVVLLHKPAAPEFAADKRTERTQLIAEIERLLSQGKGNYRNGRTWSNSKPRSLSARSLTQLRSLHAQLSAH